MNLRQAAIQALEALENAYMVNSWAWVDQKKQVITALRAALAEPDYWQEEARRYAGNADYWRKRYKALAEPEPKPVAWMFVDDTGMKFVSVDRPHKDFQPLYTAPTPRRPLTPEQLTKIELGLRVYADNDRYDLSLHDFARAVEAAHGIGEQHE